MPYETRKNKKEAQRRKNCAGENRLLVDVRANNAGIMIESARDELLDVVAIQSFIRTDEAHLVPFRIRMQTSQRMQRRGIRREQRGWQPEKNSDKQNKRDTNESSYAIDRRHRRHSTPMFLRW